MMETNVGTRQKCHRKKTAENAASYRGPIYDSAVRWRRLHGARGTRAPPLYKWLGTGGTVSGGKANTKLTKLYTYHHESAHQND